MSKYDWKDIRKAYVENGWTCRRIAEEYGMAVSTVARKSKKEKWEHMRKNSAYKALTVSVDNIAKKKNRDKDDIERVARKVLEKIEAALVDMDIKGVKIVAGALKDLKDVLDVKSDLDRMEQIERIEQLRRAKNEENKEIVVTISGDTGCYAE